MTDLTPTLPDLWQGRDDGPRLHQLVQCTELSRLKRSHEARAIAFVGFACDEGVKRNQGRLGAAEGPDAIRRAAANMPLHLHRKMEFYDVGTVRGIDGDLERSQARLGEVIAHLHASNVLPIVFGGGHEVAFGHYQGIAKARPDLSCAIVNFDAHFDLRPLLPQQKGSSGTSFLQIAEHCKSVGKDFSYTCLGIQEGSNTTALFEQAKRLDVNYVMADAIHAQGSKACHKAIQNVLKNHDAVYVTLCMDVFAAAFAPGVSAPQPLGLYPMHVAPLIKELAQSGKVIGFDIAELSPKYDQGDMTARLAAAMLFSFLWAYS